MVKDKTPWVGRLKTLFFLSFLLSLSLLSAAFSIIHIPFLPQGFNIHFFAVFSFISLLYMPPQFWVFLLFPALFLDTILQLPLGSHVVFMLLQYGSIFMMKSSLKDYGFFSHWAVFALSYGLIFTLLTPFYLWHTILTLLIYPLMLIWLLKFLTAFKQVNHG